MRTIFNLKNTNKDVKYNNFRMEPLADIFKIIQPNCWMTNVDLDAFYSIPINIDHQNISNFIGFNSLNILTCQVITQNRSYFIYSEKSVLETTQAIKFLGFIQLK